MPSIFVHQSSPENVPRGFSLVAFRLNSVRSLKEKKLVSAIYSIITVLGILFQSRKEKEFCIVCFGDDTEANAIL